MTDLPEVLNTPAAWKGLELEKTPELWVWQLSTDDITELTQATQTFIQSGLNAEHMSKADFPLPKLEKKLEEVKQNLIKGVGFQVIKGLDPTHFSRLEVATLFMGLGSHLGVARSQNAAGHLLGHVRNIGADANDSKTRIYQTNQRQTFHTDSADVVGLICLQTAQSGGESLLVSAETIYNQMQQENPDLAALLFEPVATDKRGEVEPGQKPYFSIPVFSWFQNKLSVIYQRQYIESAQRFDDAPRLSSEYIKALDLFDKLANNAQLNISMQLKAGDMQFVHNHSMLHDRGGFVDWPEPERRRHLLRLWLTTPGDRELPDIFSERFGTTQVGNRGGIIVKNTQLQVPLD